jgi:hypothetical protein
VVKKNFVRLSFSIYKMDYQHISIVILCIIAVILASILVYKGSGAEGYAVDSYYPSQNFMSTMTAQQIKSVPQNDATCAAAVSNYCGITNQPDFQKFMDDAGAKQYEEATLAVVNACGGQYPPSFTCPPNVNLIRGGSWHLGDVRP